LIFLYIISVIVYIALIFVTMSIAGNKNRSQLGFGLFAVFLPLIALIVVLIISPGRPGAVIEAEEVVEP
jgi:FtsH-binding integral membrane protein